MLPDIRIAAGGGAKHEPPAAHTPGSHAGSAEHAHTARARRMGGLWCSGRPRTHTISCEQQGPGPGRRSCTTHQRTSRVEHHPLQAPRKQAMQSTAAAAPTSGLATACRGRWGKIGCRAGCATRAVLNAGPGTRLGPARPCRAAQSMHASTRMHALARPDTKKRKQRMQSSPKAPST